MLMVVTGVTWCGVGFENEIIGADVDMAKRSGELIRVGVVVVNKLIRVVVVVVNKLRGCCTAVCKLLVQL